MKKIFRLSTMLMAVILFSVSLYAQKSLSSSDYVQALKKVTDIMVNDATSPVAAARYYSYITLASYETQSVFNPKKYPSFAGYLNKFDKLAIDKNNYKNADENFAIVLSIFKTGQKLVPSGYLLKPHIDSFIQISGLQKDVLENTIKLVDATVMQIIQYAKKDGFSRLASFARYTPLTGDGYWSPTAPAFMAPVEPHWNSIRPFVLDSAQQFKTLPPAPYSMDKSSSFYKQLMEVYNAVNRKNKEEQIIASFWDCNPFAVQQIGHVEYAIKRISPGGHWIGITGISCLKKKLSLYETAKVHALVSFTLNDAFIACWDEKYRSNRIRPETVIRREIDPKWFPLLQTPPFPEYVSGHSDASASAATVLTRFFGDNFSFVDDVEVEFNLSKRNFTSFNKAAAEAAISRLYGGIHYRDAIDQGVWQGKNVGNLVIKKLKPFF